MAEFSKDIAVGIELEYGLYTDEDEHVSISQDLIEKIQDDLYVDVTREYYMNIIEFRELFTLDELDNSTLLRTMRKHLHIIGHYIEDAYYAGINPHWLDDTACRGYSSLHVHLTIPNEATLNRLRRRTTRKKLLGYMMQLKELWSDRSVGSYHIWGYGVYPRYRFRDWSWIDNPRYLPILISPPNGTKPYTVEIRIFDIFDLLLIPKVAEIWVEFVNKPKMQHLDIEEAIDKIYDGHIEGKPITEIEQMLMTEYGRSMVSNAIIYIPSRHMVLLGARGDIPEYVTSLISNL